MNVDKGRFALMTYRNTVVMKKLYANIRYFYFDFSFGISTEPAVGGRVGQYGR